MSTKSNITRNILVSDQKEVERNIASTIAPCIPQKRSGLNSTSMSLLQTTSISMSRKENPQTTPISISRKEQELPRTTNVIDPIPGLKLPSFPSKPIPRNTRKVPLVDELNTDSR